LTDLYEIGIDRAPDSHCAPVVEATLVKQSLTNPREASMRGRVLGLFAVLVCLCAALSVAVARTSAEVMKLGAHNAHFPAAIGPPIADGEAMTAGSSELPETGFGDSIAASADGNTVIIGAPEDDHRIGGAWIFVRMGTTWTEQAELRGSGAVRETRFGYSVSISADGDEVLVGGLGDNEPSGAAWIFTRSGTSWTQQGEPLKAGDPCFEGLFGSSVALSGNGETALIGDPLDCGLGAAWIFDRSGSTWTLAAPKLTGSSSFGSSVALSKDGTTALVGAPSAEEGAGSASIFVVAGPAWEQQGGPLAGGEEAGEGRFGQSVALSADGSIALVGGNGQSGATGSAWAFERTAPSWSQIGPKITAAHNPTQEFGYSVALSGDGATALVGGPDGAPKGIGGAWLFTYSGAAWSEIGGTLTGASGEPSTTPRGAFGRSVSLSSDGGTAFISTENENLDGAVQAYIFPTFPPAVRTGEPRSVSQTTATVAGTVDPEGSEVTACAFEYGTTESYGLSVPCTQAPGAGLGAVSVSANLVGLEPGTSYHYRATATNAIGSTTGGDHLLTTPSPLLPEIGRCVASTTHTGVYSSANCTSKIGKHGGGYSWQPWPAANDAFGSTSSATTLETATKMSIKCSTTSLSGDYNGSQAIVATITLTGCEGHGAIVGSCQSEGAAPGEIRSDGLDGKLGFITSAPRPTVGLLITASAGHELAGFNCGAHSIQLTGAVIAPLTKTDTMSSGFTLKFKSAKGRQKPESLEGSPPSVLTLVIDGQPERAGLTTKALISNQESLEVKALD
jgi:hypothetical protein